MYSRVITGHAQPGKVDEAVRLYQDAVVPAIKSQRGYKGTMFLTDRVTGKGISITLWQSEADIKATEAISQQLVGKFGELLVKPATVEVFEVSVQM